MLYSASYMFVVLVTNNKLSEPTTGCGACGLTKDGICILQTRENAFTSQKVRVREREGERKKKICQQQSSPNNDKRQMEKCERTNTRNRVC